MTPPKPERIEAWLQELGRPSADRDYRPGHARVRTLLGSLHLRQPSLRVRIAGTNGKGSTAHMLASALTACGMKVGLFTSPHIHRFNERICVNGKAIDDARILFYLEHLMPVARKCGASYFEVATAIALAYFSDVHVDAEILEAGVGARLDATTSVPANMALVTAIGLDHQAWLGETLEAIAAEKACVADGCRHAISAPQVAEVSRILRLRRPDIVFARSGADLPALAMAGGFQRINAGLAYEAILRLHGDGFGHIDERTAAKAIADTRVPGRMQRFELGECRIWLDVAHNPHAVNAIANSCLATSERFDAVFVFTREDRDLTEALPALRPLCLRLIGRSPAPGMTDAAYPGIEQALSHEINHQRQGSFLVLGSFVTVAAAERWIQTAYRSST